jgi:hypothetical protein
MLCKIIQRIRRDSYKLRLSDSIKAIHLVFYTSLLRLDADDPLLGQHQLPQPPVRVQTDNGSDNKEHDKWEVNEIVDSWYSYSFLEYKVK